MSDLLGLDASGNGNNWTVNNLSITDQMLDSPTNNFCTLNPLDDDYNNTSTFSEGNLKISRGSENGATRGTIGMSSGKWYMEWLIPTTTTSSISGFAGICSSATDLTSFRGGDTWENHASSGQAIVRDSASYDFSGTFAAGTILQAALDMDNNKIWLGINNAWWDSSNGTTGNPGAGTNPTDTLTSADYPSGDMFAYTGCYNSSVIFNAGQDSSFAGNKTGSANANDGTYGDFFYTPPTGFLALCTKNLPDVATGLWADGNNQAFNTVLYAGTGVPRSVSGVNFKPDLVWLKNRNQAGGYPLLLNDSVRGAGLSLQSNEPDAETDRTDTFKEFTDVGFNLDYTGNTFENDSAGIYVAWNWKAAGNANTFNVLSGGSTTSSSSNTTAGITAGSITTGWGVSANRDAGFSIVSYTGDGSTSSRTIGHGLSSIPEFIIIKNRDSSADYWLVLGANHDRLFLNNTVADDGYTGFSDGNHTSSVISIANGDSDHVNRSGDNYIAYCFHSVDGYSKVGSYTGNGSSDGTFVHTSFAVSYVMIKRTNGGDSWATYDAVRDEYNVVDSLLQPHDSAVEATYGAIDFTSNGFKHKSSVNALNATGGTYIYIAFAETPTKFSTAR